MAISAEIWAAIQAEDAVRDDDDDGDVGNNVDNADNADGLATILQALHDVVITPTPVDWRPANAFQDKLLRLIQATKEKTRDKDFKMQVLGGVDKPLGPGAYFVLAHFDPKLLTRVISASVPDEVQAILGQDEITTADLEGIPTVPGSAGQWATYLHVLQPQDGSRPGAYVGSSYDQFGVKTRI